MTKELTLNLNEETLQRAERISKSQGKSISVLVEVKNTLSDSYINTTFKKSNRNPADKTLQQKKHVEIMPVP